MELAPKTIADLYLQGGAALLLIVLLVLALIATFKYLVKPLWQDNIMLREKVLTMNERVVVMGEASRITNETTAKALFEQSNVLRDLIAAWRTPK